MKCEQSKLKKKNGKKGKRLKVVRAKAEARIRKREREKRKL